MYRVLPRGGGLLDQDSLFIYLATEYEKAMSERQQQDQERVKGATKRPPTVSRPAPVRRRR